MQSAAMTVTAAAVLVAALLAHWLPQASVCFDLRLQQLLNPVAAHLLSHQQHNGLQGHARSPRRSFYNASQLSGLPYSEALILVALHRFVQTKNCT